MTMRKVGVYGVIGVVAAALIIAGIITSGLNLPTLQNQGTLIVKLTDAPVELKNLYVTITSLSVQKTDQSGEDGGWISLSFVEDKTSVYVDILSLQGIAQDLSVAEVPSGTYTKIRMDVSDASAIYADNTEVELIVPPGHLDVNVNFEIRDGETTTLLVDMTGHISQTNRLAPVLQAMVV